MSGWGILVAVVVVVGGAWLALSVRDANRHFSQDELARDR